MKTGEFLKKASAITVLAIFLGLGIYGIIQSCNKPDCQNEINLKPGQVYSYTYNEDNPFEPPVVRLYTVIAVKGDYVQYYDHYWQDTSSSNIEWFLIGSVFVKDVKE